MKSKQILVIAMLAVGSCEKKEPIASSPREHSSPEKPLSSPTGPLPNKGPKTIDGTELHSNELKAAVLSDPTKLDAVLDKIKSEANSRDFGQERNLVRALIPVVGDLSDEQLMGVVEKHSSGEGKIFLYSSLLSFLANNNLARLASITNALPPSTQRQVGYRELFRKKGNSPVGLKNALAELKGLSEPEDIEGAVDGLRSSTVEMVTSGDITKESASQIVKDSEVDPAIAERLTK